MKTVWVVDIDRTLADHTHRDHHLKEFCSSCGGSFPSGGDKNYCAACACDVFYVPQSSWQAFLNPDLMQYDLPNKDAKEVLSKAMGLGIDVHFITGRNLDARSVTMSWLRDHFGIDSAKNKVITRDYTLTSGKAAPASIYKEKAFKQLLELCGYTGSELFNFFDDDEYALSMYAKHGLTFRAPGCWSLMNIETPRLRESLFTR